MERRREGGRQGVSTSIVVLIKARVIFYLIEERVKMTIDDESSVYVGGLPYSANEDSVRKVFDKYGSVVAVKVLDSFFIFHAFCFIFFLLMFEYKKNFVASFFFFHFISEYRVHRFNNCILE